VSKYGRRRRGRQGKGGKRNGKEGRWREWRGPSFVSLLRIAYRRLTV